MPAHLPWLNPNDPFPPIQLAWGEETAAPGLLAAGDTLNAALLQQAYRQGIFPWFSDQQPVLWWSPAPRMVLHVAEFRLHRSLRQRVRQFMLDPAGELRFDSAFAQVIQACAEAPRPGQNGTWIVPRMQQAYQELHQAGQAHSVEVWQHGQLVAGLYLVNIGQAVFGESMFTTIRDGSKLALAGLVAFCRAKQLGWIDCQQQTQHLARLGARPIPRPAFQALLTASTSLPPPQWHFQPVYWEQLSEPQRQSAL